jgi:NAD(P)-dependent dehydrogenase (short-subunit alcohol dehydrogenase family)
MDNLQINFDGKLVVVTGGTRGIGKGIAETFLSYGATVVVCGRQNPDVLPSHNDKHAEFVSCDVRDHSAVARFVDDIVNRHGRLDVLINNAGGGPPMDAATSSPKLAERIIQLNLLAPFYCAQAANRVMQQQVAGGTIVNIASISALRPSPGTAIYSAAKAGLVSLTQGLALEWGPRVRVNAVVAGLVATEQAVSHYGGAEGMARISASFPMKRMAEPRDVALACLYLASPLADYVSGSSLAVHGGGEPPIFTYLARQS